MRDLLTRLVLLGTFVAAPCGNLHAQGWIQPSGGDPLTTACPNGLVTDHSVDATDAWLKGRDYASIEGDGFLGIGNWGHIRESLEWYCKASAAGNGVASYDIGEIFRDGYVVNRMDGGGTIQTTHYLADPATAYYWYKLSASQNYTQGMIALARYLAFGETAFPGSGVATDRTQALYWLTTAATRGDTDADLILAWIYAGVPGGWSRVLPQTPNMDLARTYVKAAAKVLGQFNSVCNSPEVRARMLNFLPEESEGREARGAVLIAARGSRSDRHTVIDLTCLLSLGPPPSRDDQPAFERFEWLIHGGLVNTWSYSIVQIPGSGQASVLRETATQAMVEGIQSWGAIVQLLYPDSTNQPPLASPARSEYAQPPGGDTSTQSGAPAAKHWSLVKITPLPRGSGFHMVVRPPPKNSSSSSADAAPH